MRSFTAGALVRVAVGLVAISLCPASPSWADDWPSWRGRSQGGVSSETGLPSSWSADGENLVWSDRWTGRSTPAVFDGRACANGRIGDGVDKQEAVACWNAETGTRLWEHRFSILNTTVPFNRVGWGSVTGDPETGYLYSLTVDGRFSAFDRDGTTVWSWRLAEELGRASGYGGRTSTPVVDEESVFLSVIGAAWGEYGGPPRHKYLSFEKRTGEVQFIATPGGRVFDMNTQSVPIVAVINGQRLLIDGNADGWVYGLQARTGETVWKYNLSKRGINVSPVLDGTTLYVGHSEENTDQGTMGRVVAIDATGAGDVTATHERWRLNEAAVGFASPVVKDGILYVVDNSANLMAIDADSGEVLWDHSVGTVGKASPVWADGKLYVNETNGRVHILQPSRTGVTVLDSDELRVEDGRHAEIYGSFAPAYGRLYFTAESGIYAIGQSGTPFRAEAGDSMFGDEGEPGEATRLQVVPAELILSAGETAQFRVRALDARGRLVGERDASWTVEELVGATVSADGLLTTSASTATQGGRVIATVGELSALAQVRVFAPLPWSENFEGGRPPVWIGGGPRVSAADFGGERVLMKSPSPSGLHRHAIYLGPTGMTGYTIQADMLASEWRRRRPDLGIINSGYTLDLQGNAQRVQLQSWAAELRIDERAEFAWESGVWYTLKLRVDVAGDAAQIRGKVWPRDEAEPSAWTVSAEDPQPIRSGSPGLLGYSPIDIYIDNVAVTENQ